MTQQLKGTIYYLYANMRNPMMIYWMIIFTILLLTSIIYFIMSINSISIQISFSTYVFCAIIGSLTVKMTIPYAIKFGSTRKKLFMSIVIFFLAFSLINSMIANTVNKLITVIFGDNMGEALFNVTTVTTNEKQMTFFHITDFFSNNTWFMMVTVDAIIIFFLMVISYFVSLVFYKYGLIGGFSFLGAMMLTAILLIANGIHIDFVKYLMNNFTVVIIYQLFGIGIIIYLTTFILIRKITI